MIMKKARIITTNEIVELTGERAEIRCIAHAYKTVDGREIPQSVLRFENEIDWEQRRYEIASAMFASSHHLTAEEAVMNAEDLIQELKKFNDNHGK